VILLAVGGFLGYRFFYSPWTERNRTLKRYLEEAETKLARLAQIKSERSKLVRWRHLSLPADPDVARREYEKHLNELLKRSGVAPGKYAITARPVETKTSPTITGKGPIYTPLTFTVQADAPLASLVRFLEEFYRAGLLQRIKTLTLQRQLGSYAQQRSDELHAQLTIEALIVGEAANRTWLLPNISPRLLAIDLAASLQRTPSGLGLALWGIGSAGPLGPGLLASSSRDYAAIASKNIFLGRPPKPAPPVTNTQPETPPEWLVPRFVYLTDLTRNERRTEGWLYDRSTNRRMRLRSTLGFNTFTFIRDPEGRAIVQGTVVRLEDRVVSYRIELHAEEASLVSQSGRPGFFPLDSKELSTLLADKVIAAGEEERVFRVDRDYWDDLEHFQVVRMGERSSNRFTIELERDKERPTESAMPGTRLELLRGRILRSDDADLVIKVEERYFTLHVGDNLEESLKKALSEEQVKELKLAIQ
jgi:hypothetical protein